MSGSMVMLMGSGVKAVNVGAHTISDTDYELYPTVASASAHFYLASDGTSYYTRTSGTDGTYADWLNFGSASNYDVRFTVTSGSFSSGTFGTWLNLGTTRSIGNSASRSTIGTTTTTGTALCEIRNATSLVVIDSDSITCSAEATSDA